MAVIGISHLAAITNPVMGAARLFIFKEIEMDLTKLLDSLEFILLGVGCFTAAVLLLCFVRGLIAFKNRALILRALRKVAHSSWFHNCEQERRVYMRHALWFGVNVACTESAIVNKDERTIANFIHDHCLVK